MISVENFTKNYGQTTVIKNLNLHIEKGQTFCLLGKNGAGKSTLINTVLDLLKTDQGKIRILSMPNNELDKETKKKIGVVAEDLLLIEEITGFEYLTFVGKIYGIPKDVLSSRINDLFKYFFENDADLKKNISKYSTGMKKKIAFCAAIIHLPEVLVLDEPFSGLDPLVANQMLAFIKKYQNGERTIFISSHDLSYIEKIATHIGVLNDGELVYNSTIGHFTENGANELDAALLKLLKPNDTELQEIDWL
ncbi:MAG: ABC transporter ATP-binding protein [Bacteroidetes bacterium]|nr:ABC transporter ATP-binding protein [Bacteroidota bacterium]